MHAGAPCGRRHLAAIVLAFVLAGLAGLPAAADTPPSPSSEVDRARSALQRAHAGAAAQDDALAAARATLAAATQQLADIDAETAHLSAVVTTATARISQLEAQQRSDQARLGEYLRRTYEQGSNATFAYIVSADSISGAMERQAEMSHVVDAVRALAAQLSHERDDASRAIADAAAQRNRLGVLRVQAQVAADVIAAEEARVTAADASAHSDDAAAQRALDEARRAEAARLAEELRRRTEIPVPQPPQGVLFPPSAGATFTVDTDLTQPSGETAANIDSFLAGTPMAGLGAPFMAAEAKYHVSARYFVAHAINESGWGRSAIARDKHNLFGYGADDAHPYQDAVSFPTFADGIDFVARMVQRYYLTPGGVFYHGPTLRGINVAYASDKTWADKVARIARAIP
jgi:flagellum-specific peptidoglycan hydrolase FlgJ